MKNKLRVLGVSNKGTKETFALFNETNDECTIILDNIKHKKTFEYLMDCLRNEKEVDRQKLFLELKDTLNKGDEK
jgi:1-aminocyclopropane-1-carboxylate deaminase/D-cysteine desulfhydrase-like pyridoxal-dependent ACC family enzyme